MKVPLIWVQASDGDGAAWEALAAPRLTQADQVLGRVGALLIVLRDQFRRALKRGLREIKTTQMNGTIRALASEMSHAVAQEPPVLQLAWGRNDLAGHLANTAYYSLLLATNVPKYLRGQRSVTSAELWQTLELLCTAAVMHDVGKLIDGDGEPVPASWDEPNELSYVAADRAYLGHPKRGTKAFRDSLHSTVNYVVANHHQRFNGLGFPRPEPGMVSSHTMVGTRIHIFARIVALANTIDHLFKADLKPSDVVGRLRTLAAIQHEEERFDPVLFNAAIRLIPPFPIGTQVTLSDDTRAVVLVNNVNAPCRPTVVRVPAENTLPACDAEPIDLRKERRLSIAEVMGTEVQSQLYDVAAMKPDPLDYWALRELLKEIPENKERQLLAVS
jgi:HD-GYP domain-containing protein (c-di-GMP phosphodiesterase class II)